MTLDAAEFIRRFLMHVLPSGFHRIRHYGLFASAFRAGNIERIRRLLTPRPQQMREPPNAEPDAQAQRLRLDVPAAAA